MFIPVFTVYLPPAVDLQKHILMIATNKDGESVLILFQDQVLKLV